MIINLNVPLVVTSIVAIILVLITIWCLSVHRYSILRDQILFLVIAVAGVATVTCFCVSVDDSKVIRTAVYESYRGLTPAEAVITLSKTINFLEKNELIISEIKYSDYYANDKVKLQYLLKLLEELKQSDSPKTAKELVDNYENYYKWRNVYHIAGVLNQDRQYLLYTDSLTVYNNFYMFRYLFSFIFIFSLISGLALNSKYN